MISRLRGTASFNPEQIEILSMAFHRPALARTSR